MFAWVILFIGSTGFTELPTKFADEATCNRTLELLVKQNHPIVRGAKELTCIQVVLPNTTRITNNLPK